MREIAKEKMKLTKKNTIFVTGSAGMLGEAVVSTFSKVTNVYATDKHAHEPNVFTLDIRNYSDARSQVAANKPSLIIHLAAETDLEYCERNPEIAWATNVIGTENMCLIAKEFDIPLVYISTAGVFDGKKDSYTEKHKANPINVYGNTKYEGEQRVKKLLTKYFIFRAGWMMGGGPEKDKKFIGKIMKQIASKKNKLHVVNDKLGTPTYTFDFSQNMLAVVKSDSYGLYHMVCKGNCSRYDVAKEILSILNLNNINLQMVSSDFFKTDYFAPRPYSEKLVNQQLTELSLNQMREWQVCLKEYLQRWN